MDQCIAATVLQGVTACNVIFTIPKTESKAIPVTFLGGL
jgi:hypothetical protein